MDTFQRAHQGQGECEDSSNRDHCRPRPIEGDISIAKGKYSHDRKQLPERTIGMNEIHRYGANSHKEGSDDNPA